MVGDNVGGNNVVYASKFCPNLILICYICPNSGFTFSPTALLQ